MDPRARRLEVLTDKTLKHLASLERDIAVIKSSYATKADIAEARGSIVIWVVSAVFLAQLLVNIIVTA